MKRPRNIQPRIGTLWRANSDAALVEKAKEELRERLRDPYVYEALQELRREEPHSLRGLVGRAPNRRGTLAAWLQRGSSAGPRRRGRGRPATTDRATIDRALFVVESLKRMGRATSDTGALRFLLRAWHPSASRIEIARAVQHIAQELYEHRRYVKAMIAHARSLEKSRNAVLPEISQVT